MGFIAKVIDSLAKLGLLLLGLMTTWYVTMNLLCKVKNDCKSLCDGLNCKADCEGSKCRITGPFGRQWLVDKSDLKKARNEVVQALRSIQAGPKSGGSATPTTYVAPVAAPSISASTVADY